MAGRPGHRPRHPGQPHGVVRQRARLPARAHRPGGRGRAGRRHRMGARRHRDQLLRRTRLLPRLAAHPRAGPPGVRPGGQPARRGRHAAQPGLPADDRVQSPVGGHPGRGGVRAGDVPPDRRPAREDRRPVPVRVRAASQGQLRPGARTRHRDHDGGEVGRIRPGPRAPVVPAGDHGARAGTRRQRRPLRRAQLPARRVQRRHPRPGARPVGAGRHARQGRRGAADVGPAPGAHRRVPWPG